MSKRAFTLVELLVILAIIGILSSFIFVQTNNAINSGKDSKRKSDVALLASGIHVYSIGSELIASSGCNIGSTCSTEINDSLTAQLGPLPTDPDTNKSYIYQSDGTDCTISAILSDGQTYQYDCSQDTMSQSSPIDGQCGSAANQGSYTIPTSNFCSDGYVPTVSGTGPWTWSCPGQYLGSPASCTAYKSVDGVCDASTDGMDSYAPLSSNLCTTGSASSVSTGSNPANYFTWSCNGEHDGTSDSCSANLKVDGVCDSSATSSSYYLSSEITSPCSSGTASSISGSGSPTGYFTWSCSGINAGINSGTCAANLKVDGVCGSRATTYQYSQTDWTANTYYCTSGTQSSSPSFPSAPASSVDWSCGAINGGVASGTCTATREAVPMLYGNIHSYLDCTNAGGEVVDFSSGKQCRFTATSCPSATPSWTYSGYLNALNTTRCGNSIGWGSMGYAPPVYCQNYDHNDGECVCPGGSDYMGTGTGSGWCCCSSYAQYVNYDKIGCY